MKINKKIILTGLIILGFGNGIAMQQMSHEDAFNVLGLQPDASKLEIKKSYRLLAKQWHTDKNKSQEALKKIQNINKAYGILIGKEELPNVANFSQSFSFDRFFCDLSESELYNNPFVFRNFYAAMQNMEENLKNTLRKFGEELQQTNEGAKIISSKIYQIGNKKIITETVLDNGLTKIEITNKIKKGFLGTTTFYERKTLTCASDSEQIQNYRRQAKAYQQTHLRNTLIGWTLGVGTLAGATYLWIYHPEKMVAFKNNVLVPGFTKIYDIAKSIYTK
jgi:hypothetical protein